MVGPMLGLSVNTSIIITICATVMGSVVPALTATLCPLTGLRQIAISRYSLGLWGSRLAAILNIVINIGYSVIAAILGGQLLRAVSEGSLSLAVGIAVIIFVALIVSIFGYGIIHSFGRYAWPFALALICALYGQSAKFLSSASDLSLATGADLSGICLTYFATIFGVCAAWCTISGDYYVHYPSHTKKGLTFGLTYVGLLVPTIFVGVLGNLLGGIVRTNGELALVHDQAGAGGLILAIMSPPDAWGKLACVVFALSFREYQV